MIPNFLRSLAAILRRLIAEGRAVHCTEADAAELELLAGLFEQHGPIAYLREPSKEWLAKAGITTAEISAERVDITPADIAFGWLKMAGGTGKLWNGPHLVVDGGLLNEDGQRIAVRAELAVLANRELVVQAYERYIQTGEKQDLSPGTIEGARAAWGFVVDKLGEEIDAGPCSIKDLEVRHPMLEKYRRELEAMK